jgi:hypothetical protein
VPGSEIYWRQEWKDPNTEDTEDRIEVTEKYEQRLGSAAADERGVLVIHLARDFPGAGF